MMPCACACFMVAERTLKFFWGDVRPYLDFGATGAPTFNLGVYLGYYTSPSPSPRELQSLGLQYERLRLLCQVWPHIQPCGPLIRFFKAFILDFLTGEYPGDYG